METEQEQIDREMARITSEEEWNEIFAIFDHLSERNDARYKAEDER